MVNPNPPTPTLLLPVSTPLPVLHPETAFPGSPPTRPFEWTSASTQSGMQTGLPKAHFHLSGKRCALGMGPAQAANMVSPYAWSVNSLAYPLALPSRFEMCVANPARSLVPMLNYKVARYKVSPALPLHRNRHT